MNILQKFVLFIKYPVKFVIVSDRMFESQLQPFIEWKKLTQHCGVGFLALRWERQAEREELRSRCRALVAPLRHDFFQRLRESDVLLGMQGKGTLRPIKGSTQTHEEGFYKGMAHYLIWEVGVHKW